MIAVAGIAAAVLASVAAARDLKDTRLDAAAVRSTLLGHELTGVLAGTNTPWRECIGRDGRTVYWFAQRERYGRVSITSDGRACFSYDDAPRRGAACFTVERAAGAGLILQHESTASRFVVTALRRVDTCRAAEAVS